MFIICCDKILSRVGKKSVATASETEDYRMHDEILKKFTGFVIEKDGQLLAIPFSTVIIEFECIIAIESTKRFHGAVANYYLN